MTGFWYFLFMADLTALILGIINLIQWELEDTIICVVIVVILSVILKGYDDYLNTGKWF